MSEQHLNEVENMLFELKHAMVPQDMETTIAHGKKIDALEFVIKQAKQSKKYRTVIRHLENAYQDMSDDETIGQDEWLGGWGAAVDFIEENIDWEETNEAKTIIEENKELSESVREFERANKQLKNNLSVYKNYYNNTLKHNKELIEQVQELEGKIVSFEVWYMLSEQQNNRYREALEFYADASIYNFETETDFDVGETRIISEGHIFRDFGRKAREALEGEE